MLKIAALLLVSLVVFFYNAEQPASTEGMRSAASGDACVRNGIETFLGRNIVISNYLLRNIKDACEAIAARKAAESENEKLVSKQRSAFTK